MKTLISKDTVEKKLAKIVSQKNKQLESYGSERRVTMRNASGFTYKVRSGIFATSNLAFNPETGYATSYRWYDLSKVFKGKLILNTYSYSSATIKHVSKLRSVMRDLGLKYETVNAPRGLQDAERAKHYELCQLAKAELSAKYSRDGKKKFKPFTLSEVRERLSVLTLMGQKITLKDWKDAQKNALSDRSSRLEHAKTKRLARKIEVIRAELPTIDPTAHVTQHTSGWSASVNEKRERLEAVKLGKAKLVQVVAVQS